MNIMTIMVLLALLEELPKLPEYSRANRRAARENTIRHNRAVYHNRIGPGIWYEEANSDGNFVGYHRSKVTNKPQQGRWATERFSGHRRFQKWSRDYHPSKQDEFVRRRWEEELKDYFEE